MSLPTDAELVYYGVYKCPEGVARFPIVAFWWRPRVEFFISEVFGFWPTLLVIMLILTVPFVDDCRDGGVTLSWFAGAALIAVL